MRPGKRAKLPEDDPTAKLERLKAGVRAKVEHSFFYIKRIFGYNKVRYRGLAKNTERLYILAGFSNMMMARKYLVT
jgi:IS5 family transposase